MTFLELDQALDPLFIWMFRFPFDPMVAFFVGLALMALLLAVIGELSMAAAYFANRKHFAKITHEMVRNNNSSIRALSQGDKKSYTALNSLANDAFGKNFFSGLALFASSIWPVAFAMGWLSLRYGAVEFPLPFIEKTVGVNFYFIPLYIVVRVLFAKSKPYLPVFKQIRQAVLRNEFSGEDLMTWGDLIKKPKNGGQEGEVRS